LILAPNVEPQPFARTFRFNPPHQARRHDHIPHNDRTNEGGG
jgi:hypothetical protein